MCFHDKVSFGEPQTQWRLGEEWTNLKLNCARATIKGLFLQQTFQVQVRARNNVGWSDLSTKVEITTPPLRQVDRSGTETKLHTCEVSNHFPATLVPKFWITKAGLCFGSKTEAVETVTAFP